MKKKPRISEEKIGTRGRGSKTVLLKGGRKGMDDGLLLPLSLESRTLKKV